MTDLINPNSIIPMYKQVLDILKSRITDQEYTPGSKLPSEADLMKQFGVSRITVRTAINELVEDGVLERSQGKGTFVALPKSTHPADDSIIGFSRSCILAGKTPSTRLLSIEWTFPTEKQAALWNITTKDRIIRSKRLRYVDDKPAMIEVNHYPASFSYLFQEDLNHSLFEALRRHNYVYKVSVRTLETCFPTSEEASLLEIKTTVPLLLFRDRHEDSQGRPSFLSKQLYNTQNLKFYF